MDSATPQGVSNRTASASPIAVSLCNKAGTGNGSAPLEDGLDMFDIQLRNEIQLSSRSPTAISKNASGGNVFVGGPGTPSGGGGYHSPLAATPTTGATGTVPNTHNSGQEAYTQMFSVAKASHTLGALLAEPHSMTRLLADLVAVIQDHTAKLSPRNGLSNGNFMPAQCSEEEAKHLIVYLAEELQRSFAWPGSVSNHPSGPAAAGTLHRPSGAHAGGVGCQGSGANQSPNMNPNDGRSTIDREVTLSLRNSRGEPQLSLDTLQRPHHPFAPGYHQAGHSAATADGTAGPARIPATRATVPAPGLTSFRPQGSTNSHGISTMAGGPPKAERHKGSTSSSGSGVIRPRPQHPKSVAWASKTLPRQIGLMTGTKKVLRSASSAFSECSTGGDTGEVSSSLSRATAWTGSAGKSSTTNKGGPAERLDASIKVKL